MKKLLLILTISLMMIGCEREVPNPIIDPVMPDIPAAPINLNIMVADRELALSWNVSNPGSVAEYRIYTADSLNGDYIFYDSTTSVDYTVLNLQNGRRYFYKISAVSDDGIEGRKSAAIFGTPNLYSVVINDGLMQTDDRLATLTMVAPVGTSLMRIANQPDFSMSPWEPFASSKTWLLTAGNGEKTVYAMFRDAEGNNTRDTLSDNIMFEVTDYAYALYINGDAERAYSRDVELAVIAPEGTSYMMVSNSPNFTGADWENYSSTRPWHIPVDIASSGEAVGFFALFRDINNDSVAVQASDSIILASADPVEIYPVFQPEDSYQAVILTWSRSMSEDFQSYRLFRSRGSSSVDTMLARLTDAGQTSYTDNLNLTNLPDGTPEPVYYMVRFSSVYGDSADSSPLQVTLVNNAPPILATFITDINYDIDTLAGTDLQATFGWQRSNIPDFESYVVYENTSPDTSAANPIFYSYEQGILAYDISKSNVDTLEVYYYWLKVFDLGGRDSGFSMPDSVYY